MAPKTIKILMDDFGGGATGIGRYFQEVVARMPGETFDVVATVPRGRHKMVWYPWYLKAKIQHFKPTVFWSPGFMPPADYQKPYVITIYDLMHLMFYSRWHRWYYQLFIRRWLRQTPYPIITASQNTKNDLCQWLECDPERIVVSYCGVDQFFFEPCQPYRPGYPYFFYAGNRRVNKNLERALGAFSQLPKEFRFLLSGKEDAELQAIIQKYSLEGRVQCLGFLSDEQLRSLYAGAIALVFVSLYEGFGLPNIEALACGTQVVTSSTSSLPEVVGDQGILVNPYEIDAIVAGMKQAIATFDDSLVTRECRQAQAARFNWGDTAKVVWDTVRQCAEQWGQ